MSNAANDKLLEEAAHYIDYLEGTILAEALKRDLDANDLEGLRFHLNDARKVAFELEFNPNGDK